MKNITVTLALLMLLPVPLWGRDFVRVASYNIRLLKTTVTTQGDRLQKLQNVIEILDADVIGLQEIDDRAGNTYVLSGAIPAKGRLTVVMTSNTMPLNNTGDDVELLDPQAQQKDQVSYSGGEVKVGQVINFPQGP